MAIKVISPKKKEKVFQFFTANGTYEHPNDLVGVLFRLLPTPVVHIGTLNVVSAGRWNMTFLIQNGPFGKYVLAISDPSRLETKFVPIELKKIKVRQAIPPRITPLKPIADDLFCTADTAYGLAPVGGGTPDPNLSSQFQENNGGGVGTAGPGTPVDVPTSANSYYYSFEYSGLPTNINPCRHQVTSDQHPNSNSDDVSIMECQMDGLLKKKKGKKGKKKTKGSKD